MKRLTAWICRRILEKIGDCVFGCFEAYRNPVYSAKELWQLLHDCVYKCLET